MSSTQTSTKYIPEEYTPETIETLFSKKSVKDMIADLDYIGRQSRMAKRALRYIQKNQDAGDVLVDISVYNGCITQVMETVATIYGKLEELPNEEWEKIRAAREAFRSDA